ncbi:restriction endonuclease subunit S [Runella sp. CRIBMP]|uniref:restriction endonuclease subunit S n=1 Tax=Runella sp. CRIBMP TaxID=2683261 RepID=UPI001413455A|nr:restriction endonuclease subunit S [Runella sp. CRIBMP]NBB19327.1 restriction endonuclease subunit S [Runella sp. CRIBMP]
MAIIWKTEPLNLVCSEIIDCVNKTAPVVDYETPYKMIRTTNVKNGRVDISSVRYVTEDTYKNWTRRAKPKRNDIILTREAPLGEVGLLRSDDNIFLGQRLVQYRSNPLIVDQLYLYYAFQDDFMQGQLRSYGSGATVEHLRIGDCETIKVKYPPLPIQQKIASILSAYDELIENNKQRIKLLEEMAEEIYKEWFVRLRFPNYENTEFVDGLPKGWEIGKLGDLVEFKKGRNITQNTISEGSVPVVAGGLSPAYYHNTANTSSPTITISASGANAGYVNLYFEDIWASDCSYLDTNETQYIFFFYLLLKNKQNEVFFLQKGSAQPHVYPKDIMALKMNLPSQCLISNFEMLINPFFEEIKILSQKNQLLQQTRDLLLPRLISGKLSVEGLAEAKEYVLGQNAEPWPMAAEAEGAYPHS